LDRCIHLFHGCVMAFRSYNDLWLAYNWLFSLVTDWSCSYDQYTGLRSSLLQLFSHLLRTIRCIERTFLSLSPTSPLLELIDHSSGATKLKLNLQIQLSWETSVVPRPRTKRAALIAIANAVSSVSHWFTLYFFLQSQQPRYETEGGCVIVGCGLSILSALVTMWWCRRKNKALEKREEQTGEVIHFRYVTWQNWRMTATKSTMSKA
jgi:hypothetical protein